MAVGLKPELQPGNLQGDNIVTAGIFLLRVDHVIPAPSQHPCVKSKLISTDLLKVSKLIISF